MTTPIVNSQLFDSPDSVTQVSQQRARHVRYARTQNVQPSITVRKRPSQESISAVSMEPHRPFSPVLTQKVKGSPDTEETTSLSAESKSSDSQDKSLRVDRVYSLNELRSENKKREAGRKHLQEPRAKSHMDLRSPALKVPEEPAKDSVPPIALKTEEERQTEAAEESWPLGDPGGPQFRIIEGRDSGTNVADPPVTRNGGTLDTADPNLGEPQKGECSLGAHPIVTTTNTGKREQAPLAGKRLPETDSDLFVLDRKPESKGCVLSLPATEPKPTKSQQFFMEQIPDLSGSSFSERSEDPGKTKTVNLGKISALAGLSEPNLEASPDGEPYSLLKKRLQGQKGRWNPFEPELDDRGATKNRAFFSDTVSPKMTHPAILVHDQLQKGKDSLDKSEQDRLTPDFMPDSDSEREGASIMPNRPIGRSPSQPNDPDRRLKKCEHEIRKLQAAMRILLSEREVRKSPVSERFARDSYACWEVFWHQFFEQKRQHRSSEVSERTERTSRDLRAPRSLKEHRAMKMCFLDRDRESADSESTQELREGNHPLRVRKVTPATEAARSKSGLARKQQQPQDFTFVADLKKKAIDQLEHERKSEGNEWYKGWWHFSRKLFDHLDTHSRGRLKKSVLHTVLQKIRSKTSDERKQWYVQLLLDSFDEADAESEDTITLGEWLDYAEYALLRDAEDRGIVKFVKG